MLNESKFSCINTKISALKAGMLNDDDFNRLINSNTVKEVFEYLIKYSQYGSDLYQMQNLRIHRGEVERILLKYIVSIIEKLILYSSQPYKKVLKVYLMKYEIEDLKFVLKAMARGNDIDNIKKHLVSSVKYNSVDFDKLLQQKKLSKLLEALADTKYYRLLSPYFKDENEKFNFYIEMVLDRYYFKNLEEAVEKLPRKKDYNFHDSLRKSIDLLNLEWIYRGINFYDMSKEEILNFLLDGGYKFNYYKLKELLYNYDLKKIREYVLKTEYKFLFNHSNDLDLFMERRIERYLYYRLLKLYKKSSLGFGKVISYIQLLEFEVKDIISVLESSRYHLSSEEISKYLIRTIKEVK